MMRTVISWYRCPDCNTSWIGMWDCACGDHCPSCGLESAAIHYIELDPDKPLQTPAYSAFISIFADVEHDVTLIDDNQIDSVKVREFFNKEITNCGFRAITDDETIEQYYQAFIDDPERDECADNFCKWVSVQGIIPPVS